MAKVIEGNVQGGSDFCMILQHKCLLIVTLTFTMKIMLVNSDIFISFLSNATLYMRFGTVNLVSLDKLSRK